MHKHRKITLHHVIRAMILAGFSFYIVHLTRIDKLQYYIAPKMMLYVKLAAMGLYVLAGYYAYLAVKHTTKKHREHECDCGHAPPKSLMKNIIIYSLFIIPLLLGFMLPDRIMGSDMAAVKGMNLTAAASKQATTAASTLPPPSPTVDAVPDFDLAPSDASLDERGVQASNEPSGTVNMDTDEAWLDKLFPEDEYDFGYANLGKKLYAKDVIQVEEEGFLEILTALDLYKNNFVGKTIEISGFVYREDDMGDNQFVVGRMAMQCCSADAMPYGFLVHWGRGEELAKDTWISLQGTIGLTEYNGYEIIAVDARKITKIDAPADPYVYPYFDDYDKLVGD